MSGHHAPGSGPAGNSPTALPVVALVGRPNVGKSTFLARASGRFAETANAPGSTVGSEARATETRSGPVLLVDLPGSRGLGDRRAGEAPFWQTLLAVQPDAVLVIVDAGDLARHLPLVLACRDLGLPIVVAANLADEAAARGVEIDTGRLGQLLAAPVVRTVGRDGTGVAEAVGLAAERARRRRAVREWAASPRGTIPAAPYPAPIEARLAATAAALPTSPSLGAAVVDGSGLGALVVDRAISGRGAATLLLADLVEPARRQVAARWADEVETLTRSPARLADRLGRAAVRPWPGIPLLLATLAVTFLVVTVVGGTLAAWLGSAWGATVSPVLEVAVRALVPWPPLASALLWGLDSGVLALLSVGLPYVLVFYLLLAVLEDSGYLASVAVLSDRVLGALGLPGRAAIPLLAATGCSVPAVYGTRVLATRRERVLGSFLATMTPCSARSAVVVAALLPFAGPVAVAGAFAAIVGLTVAAGLGANALIPGQQSPLVLEIAPLRRPLPGLVWAKAWHRFRDFARTAAPVMLVGSVVLGLLYEAGWIWGAAAILDPVVVGWLGLPSVAGLALVFAFLRKELALQLLVVLAVAVHGAGAASLGVLMSPAQLFVYAIVTSVSVPCVATLAALAGELGWRTAMAMSAATLGIAVVAGGVIARLVGAA